MLMLSEENWIFDLDGTLTVSVHDFDELRRRMGLSTSSPILEAIAAAEPHEASRLSTIVEDWEWELAELAQPALGAVELLETLCAENHRVGIVTRNLRTIGLRTLEVVGLDTYFDPEDVLGRTEAPPKPDPAAIVYLLSRWNVEARDTVMLGDYVFDIQAGRRAGARTVLVGEAEPDWAPWFDHQVAGLNEVSCPRS